MATAVECSVGIVSNSYVLHHLIMATSARNTKTIFASSLVVYVHFFRTLLSIFELMFTRLRKGQFPMFAISL